MNTPAKYVLVTAARNEEDLIEQTIVSIAAQTVRPVKWVIVDDASTDRTAEIVKEYARQHGFIELLELKGTHPPDFAARIRVINLGCELLKRVDFDFIGNLDADVTFEPSYFGVLLEKFALDPRLGLGGGFLWEKDGGVFRPRKGNRTWSVANAVQLFRRECYEAVGGYTPVPYGSPDWHAEVSARMHGWKVETFPELTVFHHRTTGTTGGQLRNTYRRGRAAFAFGSYPPFEILKCVSRIHQRPVLLGTVARLAGFFAGYWRREERSVSLQLIRFLRNEQKERLKLMFRTPWKLSPKPPSTSTKEVF
jgi:poly-beta-1,6-N-acetyl-D-glucosamine synthase